MRFRDEYPTLFDTFDPSALTPKPSSPSPKTLASATLPDHPSSRRFQPVRYHGLNNITRRPTVAATSWLNSARDAAGMENSSTTPPTGASRLRPRGGWDAQQQYLRDSVEVQAPATTVDGLWFDGIGRAATVIAEDQLYSVIRRHQPECIIVNNSSLFAQVPKGIPKPMCHLEQAPAEARSAW